VANLALELAYRGIYPISALVDGDVMVVSDKSRHLIHAVLTQKSGSYLIKQGQHWQPDVAQTLAKEALIYEYVSRRKRQLGATAELLPAYFDFDSAKQILILEFVEGAENLKAFHERIRTFPIQIGRLLGKALGNIHKRMASDTEQFRELGLLGNPPWIFSLHKQVSTPYGISGANAQLLSILGNYSNLSGALDNMRSAWTGKTLIHSDMKWENCLVYPRSAAAPDLKLKVIDWEMADLGDPLWDVGSIFQSYITAWVLSVQPDAHAIEQDSKVSAILPLEQMQPALREFWNCYAKITSLSGKDAKEGLSRAVCYAGARIVQTAFEHNVSASTLHPNLVLALQAAMNMLEKPIAAADALLGIR
jgi:hypothetical protein